MPCLPTSRNHAAGQWPAALPQEKVSERLLRAKTQELISPELSGVLEAVTSELLNTTLPKPGSCTLVSNPILEHLTLFILIFLSLRTVLVLEVPKYTDVLHHRCECSLGEMLKAGPGWSEPGWLPLNPAELRNHPSVCAGRGAHMDTSEACPSCQWEPGSHLWIPALFRQKL